MNIRLVASRSLVVGAIALAFLGASQWQPGSGASAAMRWTALALLLVGSFGRVWCSVHIAGRKNAEVVAHGPYSMTRNPLYFFSLFAFMGSGLAFESLTVCGIFTVVFFLTHWPTILSEEKYLRGVFGASFDAYCARVPRFLPKPSLYASVPSLTVETRAFTRALREASLMPLAFIGGQAVALAHQAGVLPAFFRFW